MQVGAGFLVEQTITNPGTVQGSGLNCMTGEIKGFEGQKEGMWSKVSQNIDHTAF